MCIVLYRLPTVAHEGIEAELTVPVVRTASYESLSDQPKPSPTHSVSITLLI